MKDMIHIYSIAPNYGSVTIWSGSKSSQQRISVTESRPNSGLSRRERYDVIAERLSKEFGIKPPEFVESDKYSC